MLYSRSNLQGKRNIKGRSVTVNSAIKFETFDDNLTGYPGGRILKISAGRIPRTAAKWAGRSADLNDLSSYVLIPGEDARQTVADCSRGTITLWDVPIISIQRHEGRHRTESGPLKVS
jgi:hypothetical protein